MQDSHSPAVGNQRSATSRARSFSLTSDLRPLAPRRQAFTLTELLIVIAIIAVLASLTAAAAINALRAAKRNGIVLDINNVSGAIENFKVDYGAYPPNGMIDPSVPATATLAKANFARMFKKAFPRHQEDPDLIAAIAGITPPSGSNVSGVLLNGIAPDQALVFWFGGFSSNEQYPISGIGGPSFPTNGMNPGEVLEERNRRYEFDFGRLGPRNDEDAFAGQSISYRVDLNRDGDFTDDGEVRQINFWNYTPKGSTKPLLYFDTSRQKPFQYDLSYTPPGSTNSVYALKKRPEASTGTLTKTNVAFVEPKFQVLHCGLDDDWGNFGASASTPSTTIDQLLIFPDGPFIGPIADTLTNFADGTLADASEE